ncbi:polysaccharide deacetylase family protein [Dyella sp.]|uniref:polysaccharide deacetylase family protein n=1 Tax=Dyella sp. TaxID=1869338 RepID=UPI002B4709B0|nr:polysaccharide deacetylase family protein [Dyella sp.]HKT28461.1 polysaccharide deacetylase family protein [Dyella sp.]
MLRPSLCGPSRFQSFLIGIAVTLVAASGSIPVAAQVTLTPSFNSVALPAPPPPPGAALPKVKTTSKQVPTSSLSTTSKTLTLSLAAAAVSAPNAFAGAPGANANQNTLVLYDTTGQWGWLGEAYAVMAANLVTHGSKYSMHAAVNYAAGEINSYTGLIYIGSTYGEPLPTALLDDVLATTKPVLWMNDNIWQLSARASNFAGQYGFTPMYFDFSNTLTVTYKNVALQRNALAVPSGLLQTVINDATKAQVLAIATNDTGGTINWATRGANLTYIGEIPFAYTGPNDRYLAAIDLIGQVSNPGMLARKRALVRIEDVGPDADPTELRAIADYLYSKNVPFSVAVIPYYVDPNGYYNNGVPQFIHMYQSKGVVSALKYMQSKGGTLIMHGYTHQYSNIDNPYSGVSADDFEFYLAHIDSNNYVVFDTPPPVDSMSWAQGRITSGFQELSKAGLLSPTIFEPPHYAASAIDYQVFHTQFAALYQRGLFASGWCPNGACGTGTPDYTKIYGQFYPYLVRDIFGTVVIPEQLGNVELIEFNNNPPRFPADILYSANCNTVIKDAVQSFFFHPYLNISYLQQIVQGLQAMGYTFVPASVVKQG